MPKTIEKNGRVRKAARAGLSTAPDGRSYAIPSPSETEKQFGELRRRAESHRASGGKVVAVQGLGFVGAAVAATITGAVSASSGKPLYFVIGTDLAAPAAYWKVAKLNEGSSPVASPDPELDRLIDEAVNKRANLTATTSEKAYGLADVIVVDVPLDVRDRFAKRPKDIRVCMGDFEDAIRAVGRNMRKDALVIVETTVPVGTCEKVVLPILKEERRRRGLPELPRLAHAYERVMPGASYIDSIRRFWRSLSAVDQVSAKEAENFISTFVDTKAYPLRRLGDMRSSELAKLLENSYRAANIAFIYEWALLAEDIGVNLFEVIDSIKVRKGTHDNMRYPGFGVGGYCLTKDQLLAQWGASNLLGSPATLNMTLEALDVNARMPLHTFDLLKELMGGRLSGRKVAVCGISYLPELADTRNSPALTFVERLERAGTKVVLHDPCVGIWSERPDAKVSRDLASCLKGADAVVFAVAHRIYLESPAADILKWCGRSRPVVIDAQNVIADAKAETLHKAGCPLAGVGKGHWRKRGYQCGRRA